MFEALSRLNFEIKAAAKFYGTKIRHFKREKYLFTSYD
jgi:hypothetical protein